MSEKIIENKTCSQCENPFCITDVDIDFLARLAPTIAGEKYQLPVPMVCPDCRKIQRLARRVETKLYKRKCDFSGKDIISWFPSDIPFTVYDEKVWNSDVWDPKKYGQDFDFNKSFFEQFAELLKKVPLGSKSTVNCENSEYSNSCTSLKDCYLSFCGNFSENTHYSVDISHLKSCIDCFGVIESENCYECCATFRSYNIEYSYDVKNSRDARFLLTCDGCSDCYGCFNLVNKQYCIFNISYSKEEYFQKLVKLKNLPISEQKNQFELFYTGKYTKTPLPNTGSENVFEGENIVESQNISHCRHLYGVQNARYCHRLQTPAANLVMDHTGFGNNAEKVYFCQQVGNNAQSIYFCHSVYGEVSNIFYSMYCRTNVQNCFACISLRDSQYCILNKQYSKKEYELLVQKIIGHMKKTGEWGQYFPAKNSHNGYNDSICQVLQTLTKEEALKKGFKWSDYEAPFPKVEKVIPANKLSENIIEIPDDILNRAIECEVTKKPFKIIKPELEFYRKHHLPIPRRHPEQRYQDRLKWYVNY